MYVCLCNAVTESQVRDAISGGACSESFEGKTLCRFIGGCEDGHLQMVW